MCISDDNARSFLFGEDFNFADVTLACIMQRTVYCGLATKCWKDGRHPHTEKYYAKLLQRPSFQEVCVRGYDTSEVKRMMFLHKAGPVAQRVAVVGAVVLLGLLAWKYLYKK